MFSDYHISVYNNQASLNVVGGSFFRVDLIYQMTLTSSTTCENLKSFIPADINVVSFHTYMYIHILQG